MVDPPLNLYRQEEKAIGFLLFIHIVVLNEKYAPILSITISVHALWNYFWFHKSVFTQKNCSLKHRYLTARFLSENVRFTTLLDSMNPQNKLKNLSSKTEN